MPTYRAYRIELYYADIEADDVIDAQARLDDGDVDWTDSEVAYASEGLAGDTLTHATLQDAIDAIFGEPIHVPGPECGHSVCSQNFIDTGDNSCVAPAEDDWQALWTPEHQQRACAEGWAIFTVDGDPEIQRIDMIEDEDEDDPDGEPLDPVFGSDACAVAWVLTHAKEGSPLHALALSIHRRTYPEA